MADDVRRGARLLALALLISAISSVSSAATAQRKQFTVASGIESRRVLYQLDNRSAVSLSPDGKRYLLLLIRGDLGRDGNWIELVSGRTESLDAAAQTQKVTRLFTRSYALNPLRHQPIVWLADSRRVAFLWSDGDTPYQVVTVDLETSEVAELTHHPTDITRFSLSARGDSLTFVAKVPHADAPERFRQMLRNGFAVSQGTYSIVSLLNGYPDDAAQGWYDRELYVSAGSPALTRRVALDLSSPQQTAPVVSPDGKWTVFLAPPASFSAQWDGYADPAVQSMLAEARAQRSRHSEQPDASMLGQLRLINNGDGTVTSLMDAPSSVLSDVKWSPDSQSVVVGPTCVPLASSKSCASFAEVTVPDRRVRILPVSDELVQMLTSVEWKGIREVVLHARSGDSRMVVLRRRSNAWVRVETGAQNPSAEADAAVAMQLRQDPNEPPKLVAVDAKGAERVVLEVNAGLLDTFALGKVEFVHWRDREGRAWTGRLYLPTAYRSGERVPLVIATMPHVATLPSQFSLSGVEIVVNAVAIAQPLAGRGIAVLTMGQPDDPREVQMGTPREPEIVIGAYESAVDHLATRGVIDPERVGLAGYSRSGYYVQYAITHSRFGFAAAVASDNVDQSYLQSTLAANEMTWPEAERMNGAAPFGEGLKLWLERAPGFNADRIRTPLRMELNSGGLANIVTQWELFSQLRRLRKPVELYVIPEIEKGSHGLENPRQQLASLEGAVDWLDFWLNSHEELEARKQEQYARWRRLRELPERVPGGSGS
jgi:dipeptidyl aminopeptidase/acylaminoacyl peptidase